MAADRTALADDLGNLRIAGHLIPDPASSSGDVPTSQGPGLPAIWLPQSGGGGAVDSVTAGDASVAVNNADPANPVIEAGTLDQIANLHAPAANWSNNSHKITGLAAATAATDAASLANTLDQFGAPSANVAWNSKKITGLANGSAASDALAFGQVFATGAIPIADIADPTSGKVIGSSGGQAAAVLPPGYQFDYAEITASVTITATADGNSNGTAIIDGGAVTYDGSTVVWIETYFPFLSINPSAAAQGVLINLYDGTTDLGRFAQVDSVATQNQVAPVFGRRKLTPSAGAHTYHIRGWKTNSGATAVANAGAGGASTYLPAYMRIVKA